MKKKNYVKPEIVFESLALSTHIASGCSRASTQAEFDCAVMIPEWGLSVFGEFNCDYSPPDDYDMVCYHVPTADQNVFTS